jgi:hypothetical protein
VLEAARASLTWLRVDAELAELLADSVVVLAASLFVYPGLSIVIAIVLAFTRLRHNPLARWVLLGVAVAVLVVQIVGLMAGPVSGSSSPGVPA